jgi:hypothetical protein
MSTVKEKQFRKEFRRELKDEGFRGARGLQRGGYRHILGQGFPRPPVGTYLSKVLALPVVEIDLVYPRGKKGCVELRGQDCERIRRAAWRAGNTAGVEVRFRSADRYEELQPDPA